MPAITEHAYDSLKRELDDYVGHYLDTVNLMERWRAGITDSKTPGEFADELRKVLIASAPKPPGTPEIGRASCRERVYGTV